MNQRMIIPRVSRDETTFAVIKWAGVPRGEVLLRVRRAVSDWAKSDRGRAIVASNNGDFNVGDLANEGSDPELQKLLRSQGFSYFEVDCYCDDQPTRWEFDDRLIEETAKT